jgi:hypothetical protein
MLGKTSSIFLAQLEVRGSLENHFMHSLRPRRRFDGDMEPLTRKTKTPPALRGYLRNCAVAQKPIDDLLVRFGYCTVFTKRETDI